jgi:hypothetical protein
LGGLKLFLSFGAVKGSNLGQGGFMPLVLLLGGDEDQAIYQD